MHSPSRHPQVSATARRLLADELEQLVAVSTERLIEVEPSYRSLGSETLAEQMRKNLSLTLARIAGDPPAPEFAHAAAETGEIRAAQQVDLLAVSRSFRIDLQLLWEAFLNDARRAGLETNADYLAGLLQVWEAVEANINEMTEAYRRTAERLRQQHTEIRTAAFQRLLDLGESRNPAGVAKQLTTLAFDPRRPFLVLVSDLREGDYSAISVVQARLSRHGARSYFGWQQQSLVGLIQVPARDGAHRADDLAPLLAELGEHRTALAEVPTPGAVGSALHGARQLVTTATSPGVRQLRNHWLEAVTSAEPEITGALAEQVFAGFSELSDHVREELTRVITAFLSTNGTITEVSQAAFRHRNTVRARLAQIEELTGLSLSRPSDIALLALAFSAWRRDSTVHS